MAPSIRYATTSDGVRIAFATLGEGLPVVCMPAVPFSHIEAAWQVPGQRRWYERLAERTQVVVYDSRGTGLSDRAPADFTIDALARDLDAVVQRLDLHEFVLCGFFNASPAAIAYAGEHHRNVAELVLWGGFARGGDVYPLPLTAPPPQMVKSQWDLLTETAARTWTASSGAEVQAMTKFFRACVEPQTALQAFSAARDYDVSGLLPRVRARTLVLHRREASSQRIEIARNLAAALPDAGLVVLPGEAASPFSGDIEGAIASIERFLGLTEGGEEEHTPAEADGPRLTAREAEILGLLAAGSTNKELAAQLGLSVHTVERHLTNLYGKIGARSRSEATAYAITHGYR